jgi:esterase/lipase superfamily enzyme
MPRMIYVFGGLSIVFALAGCGQQLMPTPNIYAGSTKDCFDSVSAEYCDNKVEILYATDRAPIKAKDGSLSYGTDRSNSLAFGNVTVEIGRNVSWQDLLKESRSSSRTKGLSLSYGRPTELVRLPNTPPPQVRVGRETRDEPSAVSAVSAASEALCKELSSRLSQTSKKEAYVLVHGFNNSMEDAAFVMTGLWHFMGRQGVPIIYTWPAGVGYAYDRESSEFTVYHLKQFLRGLAACKDLQKVHIIAHSRGTDVVMSALRELNIEYKAAGKEPGPELKLGNVVLAAADLNLEVARQRIMAERLPFMPERLTIYSSTHDRALGAADFLFKGGDRVGQVSPSILTAQQKANLEKLLQFQIVQARVTKNFLGHDYFHSNPAVSSDLILLLRDNRSPGEENGRPLVKQMDNFWEVGDGYPGAGH